MRRILFLTSTRIGDAVLSTGLLSHLVEANPGARFTVACGPAAASLFAGVPGLERVISVAKGRYGSHWLALWRACVATRWDLVVDLRRSVFAWTVRTRARAGLRPVPPMTHRVAEIAAVLGLNPPPAPRLWALPRHLARARELIPPGGPVLAIGPAANWRGKTWRAERFVELVARLSAPGAPFAGARIAAFAAPTEAAIAAAALAGLPPDRRIAVTAETDLLAVYAALCRCAGFVGNDSGLMHIAAAAGIPTLGLFGPSHAELYAPWGSRAAAVRTAEAYDRLVGGPGYDHRTTDTLMDGLSVDSALAAALALFADERPLPCPA